MLPVKLEHQFRPFRPVPLDAWTRPNTLTLSLTPAMAWRIATLSIKNKGSLVSKV